MARPSDDELFEQAYPDVESQARYLGKVVAFDSKTGEIRESADSWGELMSKLTDELLEAVTLAYIPDGAFVGATR